eukprot:6868-Pelagococcus_subviridis.AAC.1
MAAIISAAPKPAMEDPGPPADMLPAPAADSPGLWMPWAVWDANDAAAVAAFAATMFAAFAAAKNAAFAFFLAAVAPTPMPAPPP